MNLSNIQPAEGSTHKNTKRLGRGQGSGKGGTAARGHKGAKSRSGYSKKLGFEGGQMPIQQRLPKFGFTSRQKPYSTHIKLRDIEKLAEDHITLEVLKKNKIISNKIKKVKIINGGELTKTVKIEGLSVSKSVEELINKLGGEIISG